MRLTEMSSPRSQRGKSGARRIRTRFAATVLVVTALTAGLVTGDGFDGGGDDDDGDGAYTIGLWGDLPVVSELAPILPFDTKYCGYKTSESSIHCGCVNFWGEF